MILVLRLLRCSGFRFAIIVAKVCTWHLTSGSTSVETKSRHPRLWLPCAVVSSLRDFALLSVFLPRLRADPTPSLRLPEVTLLRQRPELVSASRGDLPIDKAYAHVRSYLSHPLRFPHQDIVPHFAHGSPPSPCCSSCLGYPFFDHCVQESSTHGTSMKFRKMVQNNGGMFPWLAVPKALLGLVQNHREPLEILEELNAQGLTVLCRLALWRGRFFQ